MTEFSGESAANLSTLIASVNAGEPEAFDRLLEVIYPELKRLAHFQLARERDGHTLNTTAVVHGAFIRLNGPKKQWDGRRHFLRAAAIVMRHLLVNHARRRNAEKRGDGITPILINGAGGGVGSIAIQLLQRHQAEVTGVDSAAKLEAMRSWGFDHVIDYCTQDFTHSGEHYDLILDVKTDKSLADYERALNPHGVYATVGGQILSLLKVACSRLRFRRAADKTLRVVGLEANGNLGYFNELFEAG